MYVCVRGGPNQPLHRDPQWSIVLNSIHCLSLNRTHSVILLSLKIIIRKIYFKYKELTASVV
jgi:hypothetical protein